VPEGRVRDADLQDVVNGLWAAGAEAVAVDGQRLTALSAIRSAGESVLVDLRPLSPPYTVEAVGDPAALEVGFVGRIERLAADHADLAVRHRRRRQPVRRARPARVG
jgi:uncharacterized protein YlxW (UPF0749 family)